MECSPNKVLSLKCQNTQVVGAESAILKLLNETAIMINLTQGRTLVSVLGKGEKVAEKVSEILEFESSILLSRDTDRINKLHLGMGNLQFIDVSYHASC